MNVPRLLPAALAVMIASSAMAAPPEPAGGSPTKPIAATSAAPTTATTKPAPAATVPVPKTAPATTVSTPKPARAPRISAPKPAATRSDAPSDSAMTLKGDREGTVFRSLTVEGEDRIHVEFDRPALDLDLDPTKAPGLDWGSARDVLERAGADPRAPLVAISAQETSPYLAHPWLSRFSSGAVARFRPQVTEVERWRLVVANARGQAVTSYEGRGRPPEEIVWDGRSKNGDPVVPGLTYSYMLEAWDRAGNKRSFVGEGFMVSAYRLEGADGPTLVFSGRDLSAGAPDIRSVGPANAERTPPLLVEAASWLNQSQAADRPLRVTATARSREQAESLSADVARALARLVIGDPTRIRSVATVEPDAPEGGTVKIASAR